MASEDTATPQNQSQPNSSSSMEDLMLSEAAQRRDSSNQDESLNFNAGEGPQVMDRSQLAALHYGSTDDPEITQVEEENGAAILSSDDVIELDDALPLNNFFLAKHVDLPEDGQVSFRLVDDAGGAFAIDPISGRITLADRTSLSLDDFTSEPVTVAVDSDAGTTFVRFALDLRDIPEIETIDGPAELGSDDSDQEGVEDEGTSGIVDQGDGDGDGNDDLISDGGDDDLLGEDENQGDDGNAGGGIDDGGNPDDGITDEGDTDEGDADDDITDEGDTDEGDADEDEDDETTGEGDTDEGDTDEGDADEDEDDETTGEGDTDEGDTDEGDTDEGDTGEGDTDEGDTDEGDTDADEDEDDETTDEGDTDEGDTDDDDDDDGDADAENLAPEAVTLSNNTVGENASDGTVIGTVSASDPEDEGLTYRLANDANGRFQIDANTGEISVADGAQLDFEDAASHQVTVEVSDGTNTTSQAFTINLGDANEAPEAVTLSNNTVGENASDGTVIGTVSASDPEDEGLTYRLANDANGRFQIDANTGEISVADGAQLDYEDAASHQVTVEVSDGTNTTSQAFTINLGDANEAPEAVTLSNNTVGENASDGTVIGTVSASDPEDEGLTYRLANDADGRFQIDANTGEISVADGAQLDYEDAASHQVTVEVSDGSNTTSQAFTINLGDANEAPEAVSLSNNTVGENASDGTVIGTVSASDPEDEGLTYRLANDANGRFQIDANTGEISVADGSQLDYEDAASHQVTVEVSDGSNTTSQAFTINLGDANEAPEAVSLSNNTVGENASDGTVVGTASANDPEGASLTYSLSDDAGGRFQIDANTGEISVADGSQLDYEDAASHQVTVEVSDGSNTTSQAFTINLGDANEAPEAVSLSNNTVGENASNGTVVGTASASDPEGASLTYSLSEDAGGRFQIDANSGEISVADGSQLDYEDAASHQVTVEVSDGTNTTSQAFTINLGDANEAPEAVSLSNNTVGENASDGTVVGTASASDPEGASLTYSLSDDAGGRFQINATTGAITVANGLLLNYEDAASHQVTVEVSDGTNTTTQAFTINLGDANEAPEAVSLSNDTVNENASDGTVVGTVSANDPEGASLTYSLSDDADGRFQIDANTGEISVADGSQLDFEDAASHQVTVEVSDGTNTTTQAFTINLGDANEAPEAVSLSNDTVNENASDGTVVGTVSANDPEGASLSYALSDDADGRFQIDANTGEISVADGSQLDFEDAASHQVTVEVSDGTNTTTQAFTINLGDLNEVPGVTDPGSNGHDTLDGGDGNDFLSSGNGKDVVRGFGGDDTLSGGNGKDTLEGGDGDDALLGGNGKDLLDGGSGDDILNGGLGDDTMSGGDGDDLFLTGEGQGNDIVLGGQGGWSDVIQLTDDAGGANIGEYGTDWTVSITQGSVDEVNADSLVLSDDAAGIITLNDGTEITFTDIERIEW